MKTFLSVLEENLAAMQNVKQRGWFGVLVSNKAFDCVIETYQGLISIYRANYLEEPTIYPVEQEPEESQEELWNKIVSSVAAANIMGSVKKPSDINGIRNWKTYIISKLTKDYTITRKTTPQ